MLQVYNKIIKILITAAHLEWTLALDGEGQYQTSGHNMYQEVEQLGGVMVQPEGVAGHPQSICK